MSNNKNSKFSSSVPCSSSSSSKTTFSFSSLSSSSSPKCSSSPSKSSKASIASSNLFSKNLRLLFLFLIFCLIQQNSEAFLLSHRNLFVPFASSKGAKTVLSTVINQVKENNQKKNEEEENSLLFSEQQKSGGHQPVRLLGFMALPEEAVKALQNQLLFSSKNQKSSFTHSRRKRMHHLSILRKIGTPHGQLLLGGGNGRLFGPQKETRELKRTEPLFLVNY
ncbi:unnamed protein product [Meloidogyne enterolobii]|uniref:Uncharacterized protein n=1 Tax=Meloidogyne enterolobii TaxID=390850 RepID=A0ACB0Z8E8_MELEN